MVRMGLLPEDKQLFYRQWVDLWKLPGKDNTLWFREATSEIKCGRWNRDREISGGQLSRQL